MAAVLTPEQEIIKAAKQGNLARLRELLAENAALARAQDEHGATPLHLAAWRGHPEVVAVLVEAGADLGAQWSDGHVGGTPLHAAAHGNQRAVAELLLSCGADPHAVSGNGRTVMDETKLHKATAVANLLRKHGVTD
jgi:ankyrin repeat protein